jgi:hypothetical protein
MNLDNLIAQTNYRIKWAQTNIDYLVEAQKYEQDTAWFKISTLLNNCNMELQYLKAVLGFLVKLQEESNVNSHD